MKNIDFLPDIYRQREALRRARWWWGAVVVIFSMAIGAAATAQGWLRHRLYEQLDALAPDYAAAQTQVQELSSLQTEIQNASQEAGLYTFLESPWPRSQLLAAVVRPLPEAIRLTQIHIREEEQSRSAAQAGPRPAKAEEHPAAKAPPAEADLAKLLEESDRRLTTIEIDGRTGDVPRLHQYVSDVHASPLVASIHIKSLEASGQPGQTRFTLRLIVRPGYGKATDAAVTAAPGSVAPQKRISVGGGE
jgi:hypothetical protein